jgi:hypothetical protein
MKILKRNGLLASPLVPLDLRVLAKKEDILVYLKKVNDYIPNSKLGTKYRVAYEGYNTFFMAVKLYWKGFEKPFPLKTIENMKLNFLRNSEKYILALKDLFNDFIYCTINKTPRKDNILDFFFSHDTGWMNKLQTARCMRSLPAFAGDTSSEIKKTLDRWTSPVQKTDLTDWNVWIESWVRFNRPKRYPDFYPISMGTSASIEFSRKEGGLKKGILKLLETPLSRKRSEEFNKEISTIRKSSLGVDISHLKTNMYLIYSALTCLEPAIKHSKECTGGCNFPASHPPMCIIAVRERGYKVRLPTMTVTPIVFLAKILRQVADAYLRNDPRIRNSLEGTFINDLKFEKKGYRSQDLTVATDHHLPEMTRRFYYLINPGVPWWEDAVSVVCNYYTIFSSEDLNLYRRLIQRFKPYHFDKDLQWFMKDKFFQKCYENYYQKWELPGELVTDLNWPNLATKLGRVSTRGQPMGVSSSWPLLPLVSIFSFERSSTKSHIEITRTVYPVLRGFGDLNLVKVFDQKEDMQTVSRQVPRNYLQIQTTGDDAIMAISKRQSIQHTKLLESLGCIVSPTKDYYSKHLAIYTEIIYLDGKVLPIWPVGPLLAPTSIRKCTWYSQPEALRVLERNFKVKIPFKSSPFFYIWKFLASLGCPLWAPRIFGGIDLPYEFPKGVQRLAAIQKLLLTEDFKNFFALHKDLPINNLVKLGMIERPVTKEERAQKYEMSYFRLTKTIEGKGSRTQDLPKRTIPLPSPVIRMPIQMWDQIFRSQFSWDQFNSERLENEEPSLLGFIHRFDHKDPHHTLERFYEYYEEIERDLTETIDVPWGLYHKFKPVFGLLLPRTHTPVFYYCNQNLDMRTNTIEY